MPFSSLHLVPAWLSKFLFSRLLLLIYSSPNINHPCQNSKFAQGGGESMTNVGGILRMSRIRGTWIPRAHSPHARPLGTMVSSIPKCVVGKALREKETGGSHCRPSCLANQTHWTPPMKQFANLRPKVMGTFSSLLGTNASRTLSSRKFTV